MPQHSLLEHERQPIALRLTLVDHTPDLLDGFSLTIETRRQDEDWSTFLSQNWHGRMLDIVEESMRAITHAWMYGDMRDVLTAALYCHRQAKKHAKANDVQ